MKKIRFFFVFAALPFFYFTACNEQSEISAPQRMNFDSPEFAVIDYFDAQNAIEDATLTNDMIFNNVLYSYSFMQMGNFTPVNKMMMGHPWLERFDFTKHLGFILRRLNLTDEQRTDIRGFMKTFHETMKPLVQKFFEVNKDIIKDANTQRKAIVDSLKAGKITRVDADKKLKELNEATRDKIKNNPETVKVKDEMCKLRDELYSKIRGILNDVQKAKWDELTKNIKSPC